LWGNRWKKRAGNYTPVSLSMSGIKKSRVPSVEIG
jgi:hypothetical protein